MPPSVLDLPQLYTRPSASVLLETISELSVKRLGWRTQFDEFNEEAQEPDFVDESGLPGYLTSIVGSPLSWIEDEDEKERIWEAASQRLAERAGRAGELTNSLVFCC